MNNDLQSRYSKMDTEELLLILNEKYDQYTPEALDVIKNELKRRDLEGEIQTKQDNIPENIVAKIPGNGISSILKVIGYIIVILGITLGLYIGEWTFFVFSFVSGIIFIGFAEVIRLLHEINYKIKS